MITEQNIHRRMSKMSVKCPSCDKSLCTFNEGSLFGHCTKCGATIERDLDNNARVYDRSKEEDENILLAYDRTDICSSMKFPDRKDYDVEGFMNEVERMMDILMTFNEIMKDILSIMDQMGDSQKYRTCELCYEMVDRIYKQFGKFTEEYSDYGMDAELKDTMERYTALYKEYTSTLAKLQDAKLKDYWADRQDEYKALKEKLKDATDRKLKIPFYNLQANWEADNEIAAIEEQLYCMRR